MCGFGARAQGGFLQTKEDQIDAVRRRFFQERVQFTTEEEEKFWPAYYTYQEELKRIRLDVRSRTLMLDRGVDNLSEDQLRSLADVFVNQKQQEADIYSAYLNKLKGFLSSKKIVQVYMAERAFVRELLNRLRSRGATIPPEYDGGGMP